MAEAPSKGHGPLIGTSYSKSATCLVCCSLVLCKWRCNVVNLSCDLTRPHHSGVMQIFWGELLRVCHHSDKFCDQRHCDRRVV